MIIKSKFSTYVYLTTVVCSWKVPILHTCPKLFRPTSSSSKLPLISTFHFSNSNWCIVRSSLKWKLRQIPWDGRYFKKSIIQKINTTPTGQNTPTLQEKWKRYTKMYSQLTKLLHMEKTFYLWFFFRNSRKEHGKLAIEKYFIMKGKVQYEASSKNTHPF